ncbi:FadR/GntR family transcriptional regulator [Pseudovibrio flavus]|uniref:FadR/GntR family transcriptional regulator n=1 Tax=Pseudovibrio flavus TaxID=2529854 RepID=UPI0035283431
MEPILKSTKEPCIEGRVEVLLRGMISNGRWQVGQRLPAERMLSEELGVSRNTLRSVLRRLEARGFVQIKKGSGCYLTSISPREVAPEQDEPESLDELLSKFEAGILFLPNVFAEAAPKMDAMRMHSLQRCTGLLGKAILEENWPEHKRQSLEFFKTVVDTLENPVITQVACSICASTSEAFPRHSSFEERSRHVLFSDFVHLLKALETRDPVQASKAIRSRILNTAIALSDLKNLPLPPVLKAAADEHLQELAAPRPGQTDSNTASHSGSALPLHECPTGKLLRHKNA